MVNIKFSKELLVEYAELYEQKWPDYIKQEEKFFEWFNQHRYLNKETFIELGRWKTKRQTKNYSKNSDDFIKKTTTQALLVNNDNDRLEILMRLRGVSWAVGSVILHFAFPNQYPILDFRAIWSLGFQQPKSYNFEFWQQYVATFRKVLHETSLDARTIDRGLWMYSKIHQKTDPPTSTPS